MTKPAKTSIRHSCIKSFTVAAVFACAIILITGCGGGGGGGGIIDTGGGGTQGGPGTVNLIMTISNLQSLSEEAISGSLAEDGGFSTSGISPLVYKIALVNFWLIKDDNTGINLMNPDKDSSVYTEENPLIVDFSSGTLTEQLLNNATLPEGTYTGYKIQFLYIEMQFPVYFHLPSICMESDLANLFGIDPEFFNPEEITDELDCNFRLYFNAHDKYWKRDFVANLNIQGHEDEWFWLRREIDESHSNFFISVTENTHPSGGTGPESITDLFNDPGFWGNSDNYNDSSNPIIIESGTTAGGLNAVIEPFTISGGKYNITVNVDVKDTFNFTDNSAAPAGVTFHTGSLDLGPAYELDNYGDTGLHPLLPAFSVVSEKVTG
ncbi:MAG TPA: hypothetical protein VIS94_16110 [Desulfomonilia bacterium]